MSTWTVIADFRRPSLTTDSLEEAARHASALLSSHQAQSAVVFADDTGAWTEADPTTPADDVAAMVARLSGAPTAGAGPGRPKLGVISREVSLLPRHWDWLGAQPGGASAAIRRLVEEARRRHPHREEARAARDAVGRFMNLFGGDLPAYEEISRDLYAGRFAEARAQARAWPDGLGERLVALLDRAEALQALAEPDEG